MMRVFLDIGSHIGETVAEVAKPKYGFDRIVCFEPSSRCWPALTHLDDPRLEICPFGLGAKDERVELHNPGSLGASVFGEGPTEAVDIADVAEWFRANLDPEDFVVVKTNCEGAEVDIVDRLDRAGLLHVPVTLLITFDIRDFPEHRHKEITLRRRLRQTGLTNFCFSDDVMIGPTHDARIAHWLSLFGIDKGYDRRTVEMIYRDVFKKFARRTGRRQRIEARFKDAFGYASLPEPAKNLLRYTKRALGLSRET